MKPQPTSLHDAVSAQLRAERSRQRITFDELVKITGLSKSALSNYFGGYREINLPTLEVLSEALGLPVLILIDRAVKNAADEVNRV